MFSGSDSWGISRTSFLSCTFHSNSNTKYEHGVDMASRMLMVLYRFIELVHRTGRKRGKTSLCFATFVIAVRRYLFRNLYLTFFSQVSWAGIVESFLYSQHIEYISTCNAHVHLTISKNEVVETQKFILNFLEEIGKK